MVKLDLSKWMTKSQRHTLFFDRASKGNPGVEGGGWILVNPDGTQEHVYSWGLGDETNNFAEALALWQGLS